MSVWEFFASIIGSMAWPAALVALVVILRQPISGLANEIVLMFGRAKSVTAGWGSGQIALELEKLRNENAGLPESTGAPSTTEDTITRLLAVDPKAAMLSAIFNVEASARNVTDLLTDEQTTTAPTFRSFGERIDILRGHGLPEQAVITARYIRGVRNELVHGFGDDLQANAAEVIALARELTRSIEALRPIVPT
ncbi:hypothetical protein GTV32_18015 [Gordonia sp. SID5947]|uniref:hypothetical protein n=1 Tax=Gordonia sp. SID5947 TaxID=2690315 RepID=UPI00136C60EB|nr:hypothetical protein [Gordonia sp. SID5947]MYR08080.1 hypothetical protein [Gordonia sp. SID5947]